MVGDGLPLDWLVGALLLVNDKGEGTAYKKQENQKLFKGNKGKDVYLVTHSIEDIDLEQNQDRYTHRAHSSFMLKFSGEVTAT